MFLVAIIELCSQVMCNHYGECTVSLIYPHYECDCELGRTGTHCECEVLFFSFLSSTVLLSYYS